MNFQRAPTGFRIGASVGIIVLMLGIAIALSISATSAISDQLMGATGFTLPLEKSALQMENIEKNKEDALNNAVKIIEAKNSAGLQEAEASFYLYDGLLSDEMNHAMDLANVGSYASASQYVSPEPSTILAKISELENLEASYDQSASSLFSMQDAGNSARLALVLSDLKDKGTTIGEKQASVVADIESSYQGIENSVNATKQKFLTLEIIITVSAGIISLASGYFVNQINKDLVSEVVKKTKSLQKANEKLRDLNILKDEFITEASHELKSPLNPIYGFVELAKCGDIGKEEALSGIAKQAHQIEEVANKMLDLGRVDGNRLHLSVEKFSLNDLISDLIEAARAGLSNGVVLEAELPGVIDVEGDRVRIGQVIRNVLSNATKFTSKGRIVLSASSDGRNATVRISDTGLGIHPDILPVMFNKFVTKTHRRENLDGSGLGLYISKGIIEAHGGHIHAQNNKGAGATVSFSIPLQHRVQVVDQALLN